MTKPPKAAQARKPQVPSHPPHVISFVRAHEADARRVAARTGVPTEVILAQSALESSWGRAVRGNAYFGVKGKSPSGSATQFLTHEVTLSGQRVKQIDEFRAYASYSEAADDYASLIQRRYAAAMVHRTEPERFAEAVARQGYATDPQYAGKLKSIIRRHVSPLLTPVNP